MYCLEIGFINQDKKEIKVNSLEEALVIIHEFEWAKPNEIIEIKTDKGFFSFQKNKATYVEMMDSNENISCISRRNKY